jgi:hypothetical protein
LADAFAIKSSKPSSRESEGVALNSISTGLPVCNAHRRPSTPSGEVLVKTVHKEIGTVALVKKLSTAEAGFSSSKGTIRDMTLESVVDFSLWFYCLKRFGER